MKLPFFHILIFSGVYVFTDKMRYPETKLQAPVPKTQYPIIHQDQADEKQNCCK